MQRTSTSRSSQDDFAWSLGGDAPSIVAARRAFEAWLRGSSASDDDVHDMTVVLSELASNAATRSAVGSTAEIHASIDGRQVHLEVTNRVDERSAGVVHWDLDDPLRGGGRGLLIVRAYTDSMEVDSIEGAVRVRCVRRLDPPA